MKTYSFYIYSTIECQSSMFGIDCQNFQSQIWSFLECVHYFAYEYQCTQRIRDFDHLMCILCLGSVKIFLKMALMEKTEFIMYSAIFIEYICHLSVHLKPNLV